MAVPVLVFSGTVEFPTDIANAAVPGEPIVPRFGPLLPVAIQAVVPAKAALLMAIASDDTWLLDVLPKDKLIMSMFSAAALSMPAITPEFDPLPYAPNTL